MPIHSYKWLSIQPKYAIIEVKIIENMSPWEILDCHSGSRVVGQWHGKEQLSGEA